MKQRKVFWRGIALFLPVIVALLPGCSDRRSSDLTQPSPIASNTTPTATTSSADTSTTRASANEAHSYQLGTTLRFGAGTDGEAYKGAGWSTPETDHTWSDKTVSTLLFAIPTVNGPLKLHMNLSGLVKQPELPFQPVEVVINGTKIADWQVAGLTDYAAIIPADIAASGRLQVELRIPKATSPAKLGLSEDDRILGVSISEIKIEPAP